MAAEGDQLRCLRRTCHYQAPSRGDLGTAAPKGQGDRAGAPLTTPSVDRAASVIRRQLRGSALCRAPRGGGPPAPGAGPASSSPPMRKDTLRGGVQFGSISCCHYNTHFKFRGSKLYKRILSQFWRPEALNAPDGAKITVSANHLPAALPSPASGGCPHPSAHATSLSSLPLTTISPPRPTRLLSSLPLLQGQIHRLGFQKPPAFLRLGPPFLHFQGSSVAPSSQPAPLPASPPLPPAAVPSLRL